MNTEYQINHIILGNTFSKARKLSELHLLQLETPARISAILEGETREAVLARVEADDRTHWITLLGRRAAADLLTLGKVQPETMLEMSAFPEDDFKEIVKIATGTAKRLNNLTIEAEKELNMDSVTSELI